MSNHHFGEIGDVWKHLALTEILSIEQPDAYWETHAGSASYPMDDTWERRYGIGTFLAGAATVPELRSSRYFEHVRELAQRSIYPGSALLAMRELGPKGHYLFCDTDMESTNSLETAAIENGIGTARSLADDGITTVWNATFNSERPRSTVLVHIDPFRAFEESSSTGLSAIDLAPRLAEQGFKIVYWYGFGDEGSSWEDRAWAWRRLGPQFKSSGVSCWCGEIVLRAFKDGPMQANPGVMGCGIVCANLSPESHAAAARLGRGLASLYVDTILPTGESGALLFNDYGDLRST